MLRLRHLAWMVVVVAAAIPAVADDKFEVLFDGSSLEGWKHAGNWKIEDGAIYRESRGGDLEYVARPVPNDFELRFEWKVAPGTNSGIYYRPGQYEYQILDNAAHRDGKNPRTSAASLYFCMAPSRDATREVGQWNEGRIVCKGTVIQHWLNGERVVDFDYADRQWAEQVELLRLRGGTLGDRGANLRLQDHGDPVWYRNIRIREIPPDEPLVSQNITPAPIPAKALEYERQRIEQIQKSRSRGTPPQSPKP